MYRIKDAKYGSFVDDLIDAVFVKVQKGTNYPPILAESYDDADGVVLSDGNTMLGIEGRNMQDYTPLVTVEEISAEPMLFQRVQHLEEQNTTLKEQNEQLKQNQLDVMDAIADLYLMQDGGANV